MAKVVQVRQKEEYIFDPNKNYKWNPTDIFEFTGQQLASLYHCLTQEMRNPGGAPLLMKAEAYNVIMDLFKSGVEQGVIVEAQQSGAVGPMPTNNEVKDSITKIFE